MRIASNTLVLLLAALSATACTKKSQSEGLPPAQEWGAGSDTAGAMVPMPSKGPGAAPHGMDPAAHAGADPNNPHAGLGLNPDGTPMDPTASTPSPHGGGSANVTPEQTEPRTLDKLPDGRLAMGPFSLVLPKDWAVKPITSSMRAADFVLAAPAGLEAELVVTYFGQSGAGPIQDNIDRWAGQFGQQSGTNAAKVEQAKFADQAATIVSVSGHYAAAAMAPGQEAVDKPDQALLAAIVASPQGPYYFKLVGAKKTVDANNAAFRGLLASLKIR